ncbi:hypothetical protein GUJ93_ZPchr0010g9546 [Zizania palustris]|uniref:Uncharacterized protein n=1 Tax=Zizania palustris TaxID=103762 RepID=A0A8J5W7M8_ZIZPA|nr:hypothetical protein GUJ93_ZPchr0010g9546 [Zizania palustris]
MGRVLASGGATWCGSQAACGRRATSTHMRRQCVGWHTFGRGAYRPVEHVSAYAAETSGVVRRRQGDVFAAVGFTREEHQLAMGGDAGG